MVNPTHTSLLAAPKLLATQVPEAGDQNACLGVVPTFFYRFAPCGTCKSGTTLGAGESWLLQRGTRASWGGCWPGRCHAQAQPILPAVSVGSRDAARGSLSTTRRTHARSTRNGGLSTNAPVGDARRRTHRGVRWRSGTCSESGSAASGEASAPASLRREPACSAASPGTRQLSVPPGGIEPPHTV